MTQTPETKTPTRAEALTELKKLHPKHGVIVTDEQYKQYETDCSVFIILNYDLLQSALATEAPIVEGLEEAIDDLEASIEQSNKTEFDLDNPETLDAIGNVYGSVVVGTVSTPAEIVLKAAKLYAQGRTQSAVPEGWKLVPIELSPDMKGAGELAFLKAKGWASHQSVPTIYKSLLSAAPPVTGGAWRKVDPDNIYQGYFAWLDEDSDDQEPIVCAWPPMDKYAKCFKRGYYYPLPDPPSSAEKEGNDLIPPTTDQINRAKAFGEDL